MIVINLKNYKVGKDILELVKKIEIYYNKAILAVPATELKEIAKSVGPNMQVYAQHIDFDELGRGTGKIIPESIISSGAVGSLLNHSEHKLKLSEIKKTIRRCNEIGLKLIVCVSTLKEAKEIAKLNPYALAFEDKALIATGKSITEHKQNDIKKFAEALKDTKIIPLCGAGINSGEDVAQAIVLGCKGVLVSSAVANSQNPEKFLKEVSGLF
jgi:triosephosphate isomerase